MCIVCKNVGVVGIVVGKAGQLWCKYREADILAKGFYFLDTVLEINPGQFVCQTTKEPL